MTTKTASEEATAFLENAQKAVDLAFQPTVVLPGDDVTSKITVTGKKLKLGEGLQQHGEKVFATQAGILRYRPPNRYWIQFNHKRYIPSLGDSIIGIVEDRNAELYRLNIGSYTSATLPQLSFDGASKRNRPNLQVGSLVYTRICKKDEYDEPEVTCEAPASSVKKEWMTGQAIYGELRDGYIVRCSVDYAKRLLKKDCIVLETLGKSIPFEIAIGLNGFIWMNAGSSRNLVLVSSVVLNAETLTDAQAEMMIEKLLKRHKDMKDADVDMDMDLDMDLNEE